MAKKTTRAKKTAGTAAKKGATTGARKDAAAFVDFLHTNKEARAVIRKGWDDVIRAGKKKGFNFSKKELKDHLKKRYNITSLNEEDEPDTCLCI